MNLHYASTLASGVSELPGTEVGSPSASPDLLPGFAEEACKRSRQMVGNSSSNG
jgi:hypothetical protein